MGAFKLDGVSRVPQAALAAHLKKRQEGMASPPMHNEQLLL
jgi:hypothetical protein